MRKVVYNKRHTVTIAATGTSFTFQLDSSLRCRGRLAEIVLQIPDYTNAETTTLSIVRNANQGGGTVFTSSAYAENTNQTLTFAASTGIFVSESDIFTLTLSNVAGAGGGTLYATVQLVED